MVATKRAGLQSHLYSRFGSAGDAIYMFIGVVLALTVSGTAAHVLRQPLLFPSLGPTALLFFETPLTPQANPRNTVIGHLVAIGAGVASLGVFGLLDAPSVLQEGVSNPRIAAAALSLALTGVVLILLRSHHPPAGATTLVVSLGLLTTATQLVSIAAGVLILTVTGWIINRALGVPVSIWNSEEEN